MPYKDKDKNRELARLNYYKNREKRLIQQKNWDSLNKSKKREYDKKRRLEKRDNYFKNLNHYSQRHHYPVLLRKYEGCRICKSKDKLETHHIRYTKKIKDVMLLCQKCHKRIHRKI